MASRADIAAGRAFVELFVHSAHFAHGLLWAENRLKAFAVTARSIGQVLAEFTPVALLNRFVGGITSIGNHAIATIERVANAMHRVGMLRIVAGGSIASGMLFAASTFGHVGDSLWVLAQRTGAGTEALSGFGYAARQTGATIDDVENGLRAMQRAIGDAAAGTTILGVTVEELSQMKPEDQFQAMGEALAGIEDPAKRTAAAMDVFGRSGQSLLPMLIGLREFMDEANSLGLFVNPTQARLAEQLIDKFQALKEAAFAIVFSVGEALAPALLEAIHYATDVAKRFRAWVVDNKEVIQLIAKVALATAAEGAMLIAIGASLKGVSTVLAVLLGGFSTFGHLVAALLPLFTILRMVIVYFGIGPILAFVSSIGSAVAASGFLATAISALGTFATLVLPEVAMVAGLVAASFAAIIASVVGTIAIVGAATYAFFKLTDPITALIPLLTLMASSVRKIATAMFMADFYGAAVALITAVKYVLIQGSLSILTIWKSAMTNISTLIGNSGGVLMSQISKLGKELKRILLEFLPVMSAVFAAFYAAAKDTFDQLPKLAGHAIGKILRLAFDGLIAVQGMIGRVFVGLFDSIIKLFTNFVPLLVKAMTTGGTGGLEAMLTAAFMESIKKQAEALGAVFGGAFGGVAPEFKMSPETMAAFERLRGFLDKAMPGSTSSSESHKKQPSDIDLASSAKSFSTYSAAAAQALGRGSQAPTDRLLVEAREHRRISERMLALSRRSLTAAERMVAGLAMR